MKMQFYMPNAPDELRYANSAFAAILLANYWPDLNAANQDSQHGLVRGMPIRPSSIPTKLVDLKKWMITTLDPLGFQCDTAPSKPYTEFIIDHELATALMNRVTAGLQQGSATSRMVGYLNDLATAADALVTTTFDERVLDRKRDEFILRLIAAMRYFIRQTVPSNEQRSRAIKMVRGRILPDVTRALSLPLRPIIAANPKYFILKNGTVWFSAISYETLIRLARSSGNVTLKITRTGLQSVDGATLTDAEIQLFQSQLDRAMCSVLIDVISVPGKRPASARADARKAINEVLKDIGIDLMVTGPYPHFEKTGPGRPTPAGWTLSANDGALRIAVYSKH